MKIHKSNNMRNKDIIVSFNEIPLIEGDIIYVKSVKKQLKKQIINNEWVEINDVYEWWIKDYIKVT
jgi:hypothetical protein